MSGESLPKNAAPHKSFGNYRDICDRLAPELTYGGLWLKGGELNTLPEEEWEKRDFRALFVRLSTYFDTGYSFTHQFLYQLCAGLEGVYPDVAFLPPPKDAPLFEAHAIPWLLGTQSKRGPRDFDLIGFSNSIVQELINIPHFLVKSGIALRKSERLNDPEVPLLIVGGANALYSSALWEADPMIDGVFVGESDKAIREIIIICQQSKREGLTKAQTLERLETVSGFFQPDKPRPTQKAFIWSLNKSESLSKGPIYFIEDQIGKGHLQISEGCPCFCSFCAESWDRKPYREKNRAALLQSALEMKANMGLDTIELYSFNFNMHSDFYGMLWDLAPYFKRIGLKSQRFDLLAHDPEMIEFQHAIEKASITCGLEGISPRLRRYLHKNLENTDLHRSLSAIFGSKARELKVFLIATGLEEAQDFDALADLLDHMKKIQRNLNTHTRVIFSMTPLVRFPWTPLEFEDAYPVKHYEKIISKAARTIRQEGFEFRESADLPEYWVSQVLVRADSPKVACALRDAVFKTQFVYHREIPYFFQKALDEALKRRGLDPEQMLKGHTLEESHQKPWAKISTGVKREFLWQEVERARKYVEIDYCLGRAWQESKCFLCGGCPSPEHILNIVKTKQTRDYSLEDLKNRMKAIRDSEEKVAILLDVQHKGRGIPRNMVGSALARALMLSHEPFIKGYRGYQGSYWEEVQGRCPVEGEDRFTLAFERSAAAALRTLAQDSHFIARVNEKLQGWGVWRGLAPHDWRPKELSFSGDFAFHPEAYFKGNGLKFTLRKQSGVTRYELALDSLKKRILERVEATHSPFTLTLSPGPKFQLGDFLEKGIKPQDGKRSPDYRLVCNPGHDLPPSS